MEEEKEENNDEYKGRANIYRLNGPYEVVCNVLHYQI